MYNVHSSVWSAFHCLPQSWQIFAERPPGHSVCMQCTQCSICLQSCLCTFLYMGQYRLSYLQVHVQSNIQVHTIQYRSRHSSFQQSYIAAQQVHSPIQNITVIYRAICLYRSVIYRSIYSLLYRFMPSYSSAYIYRYTHPYNFTQVYTVLYRSICSANPNSPKQVHTPSYIQVAMVTQMCTNSYKQVPMVTDMYAFL